MPKSFRSSQHQTSFTQEPFFSHEWHLENTGQFGGTRGADIRIKEAWEVTAGSSETIIAILDEGFELSHPDLFEAWYKNHSEIPKNRIDDDKNGYIDDVTGWDFVKKNGDVSALNDGEHGTAVAGLVGARQNGKGVVGVCPNCTLLPIVVSRTPIDDAAAFYYADKMGAQIITSSWGYAVGTPTTDVVAEATADIAARGRGGKGSIILFAMNNVNQDDCIGQAPDISSLESVIAVSASSDLDMKVAFSGWGDCMEFLAPTYEQNRAGITTTDLQGVRGYNYGRNGNNLPDLDYTNNFGGTSASTPIAAGVFGLLLTVNKELTRNEALALMLSTADKVQPKLAAYDARSGFSKKYGYGRINAAKAVRAAEVFRKYTQKPLKPLHEHKGAKKG